MAEAHPPFPLAEDEGPVVVLGDRAVHALLTDDVPGLLAFARTRLREIAQGRARCEAPPKQVFEAPDGGDLRVMACVVTRPEGRLETVKIVGTNRAQQVRPGQITVGSVCMLDPHEHFVTHRFDACAFSSARTGLLAALAIEALAPARERVLVVGAGRVGYYAARYCAAVEGVHETTLADRVPARAVRCADALRPACAGVRVVHVSSAPHAAPVAVLATDAAAPVWPLADGTRPALAVSVGADARAQRELHPAWHAAELYTDGPDSLRTGDLAAWACAGLAFGPPRDLGAAIASPPPPGAGPRAVVSTGTALWDNLTCAYLLERLEEAAC
jgi:ornithine cyclodeaminase/alanine dehydrogenase-like protein (mu-crystallin family)